MVEVYKTNVIDRRHANMLVGQIHQMFEGYEANFDLEDSDRILRIKYTNGLIQHNLLINLLKEFGFSAEVLPDEYNDVNHASISMQGFGAENE